jgi:hypothetical protein
LDAECFAPVAGQLEPGAGSTVFEGLADLDQAGLLEGAEVAAEVPVGQFELVP